MTFCSCCNLIVSDFITCEVYRSDHHQLGQAKKRYLNIIVNEPCPGLDVLCREGHDFLWDIVPGLLRWLVRRRVHRRIFRRPRLWWRLAEQRLLLVGLFTSWWVIRWLVWGLGGGHCRGMDQKCTRVDARYGCQPLHRDFPLGWRRTQPTPRHRRRRFRQQRTRQLLRPQRKILSRHSQGSEMQTNNSSVPTFFPVVVAYNLIQAQVEVQLYHLEASYLTETTMNSGGNIITGFENYLKNQGIGRRKFEVTDSDRMFSASSTTYQRVRVTQDVFSIPNLKPMRPVSRTHGGRGGIHHNTGRLQAHHCCGSTRQTARRIRGECKEASGQGIPEDEESSEEAQHGCKRRRIGHFCCGQKTRQACKNISHERRRLGMMLICQVCRGMR